MFSLNGNRRPSPTFSVEINKLPAMKGNTNYHVANLVSKVATQKFTKNDIIDLFKERELKLFVVSLDWKSTQIEFDANKQHVIYNVEIFKRANYS